MKHPASRRLGATLLRVCRSVLLIYCAATGLLFFAQGPLIFAGSSSRGRAWAHLTAPASARLLRLRADGGEVAALWGPALRRPDAAARAAASRPAVLLFYGNGTCLSELGGTFRRFRELGADVMIPEYLGYGLSTGGASERGCYATADAAYEYLTRDLRIAPGRIVAAGYSLGGAVAIDLAARRPVGALAAFNTFPSLTAVAAREYPLFPVPWLLQHRFESDRKIGRVRCPVLLANGSDDTLVPLAMSERLAAAVRAPLTRLRVQGAGHNDLFDTGDRQVFPALERLIDHLATPAAP